MRTGFLMLTLIAACDADLIAPRPEAEVRDEAGLSYRAVASRSADGALRAEVTVANGRATPIDLRVASHCTVLIRAWRTADYTTRPVWDQAAESKACSTLTRTVRLDPGETRVFEGEARPVLERGRYFLSVVLRGERPIEVAAGYVDIP